MEKAPDSPRLSQTAMRFPFSLPYSRARFGGLPEEKAPARTASVPRRETRSRDCRRREDPRAARASGPDSRKSGEAEAPSRRNPLPLPSSPARTAQTCREFRREDPKPRARSRWTEDRPVPSRNPPPLPSRSPADGPSVPLERRFGPGVVRVGMKTHVGAVPIA